MICPKCRHENPDDAVICEFCGEPLNLEKPLNHQKIKKKVGIEVFPLQTLKF
ncbi:zinc-ribbon domain-containing protein [Methanobacterium ferruginis]|uniref:zinc-ribbon domain-containing protein n=1 Tax=Methanobacterium ferruginis TaxID=710191 RepID=UPI0025739EBF|nr:zinc-ribbon domain-containing protein [Methanobacterium ferruginis]